MVLQDLPQNNTELVTTVLIRAVEKPAAWQGASG